MSAESPAIGIDHPTVVPANDNAESVGTESVDIETTKTETTAESDEFIDT